MPSVCVIIPCGIYFDESVFFCHFFQAWPKNLGSGRSVGQSQPQCMVKPKKVVKIAKSPKKAKKPAAKKAAKKPAAKKAAKTEKR